MSALVSHLQATGSQDGVGVGPSVGGLWVEVNRLKRQGQNVRTIEWNVAELEGRSRGGQQNAAARRHILNNLSYQIDALHRRSR